jgi:glycosyltransferase involved in cell wall biosynthesis
LHVATRALKILNTKFDNIELRVAGNHQINGLRKDGYIAWLIRENCKMGIEKKITWLGPLKEEEIIRELLGCSVFIMPSYIESYSVALIEAMTLGVPSVVSYVGGLSEMAKDRESALFFSPGDHAMCAYQVEKILLDNELADNISKQAREILSDNDVHSITTQLIDIYKTFLTQQCPVRNSRMIKKR